MGSARRGSNPLAVEFLPYIMGRSLRPLTMLALQLQQGVLPSRVFVIISVYYAPATWGVVIAAFAPGRSQGFSQHAPEIRRARARLQRTPRQRQNASESPCVRGWGKRGGGGGSPMWPQPPPLVCLGSLRGAASSGALVVFTSVCALAGSGFRAPKTAQEAPGARRCGPINAK